MTEPIEQKAKFLAESGNVTRDGNAFTVLQPTAHGSDGLVFTVKRRFPYYLFRSDPVTTFSTIFELIHITKQSMLIY